jgi:hypothetical protein
MQVRTCTNVRGSTSLPDSAFSDTLRPFRDVNCSTAYIMQFNSDTICYLLIFLNWMLIILRIACDLNIFQNTYHMYINFRKISNYFSTFLSRQLSVISMMCKKTFYLLSYLARNMFPLTWRKQIEYIWEQCNDKDLWTSERICKGRIQTTAQSCTSYFVFPMNIVEMTKRWRFKIRVYEKWM